MVTNSTTIKRRKKRVMLPGRRENLLGAVVSV